MSIEEKLAELEDRVSVIKVHFKLSGIEVVRDRINKAILDIFGRNDNYFRILLSNCCDRLYSDTMADMKEFGNNLPGAVDMDSDEFFDACRDHALAKIKEMLDS